MLPQPAAARSSQASAGNIGKIGWMPRGGGSALVMASRAHLIHPQWRCRRSIVSLRREPCLVLSAHYLRTTDLRGGDEKTDTPTCSFLEYLYNSSWMHPQPALRTRRGGARDQVRIYIQHKRDIGNYTRCVVLWYLNALNDGLWSSIRISRQKSVLIFARKLEEGTTGTRYTRSRYGPDHQGLRRWHYCR